MTNGTISSATVPDDFPPVVCVVLNWNGWQDTVPCLHALTSQDYPSLQILVVDNASTDDSVARIREAVPGVELLESPVNHGFSAGNNLGIRAALERGAAFVWLLNNDTIAPPDTLTKLVAAASDSRTGMVGTVLHYAHNPRQIQAWGGGSIIRSIGFGSHFYAPTPLDSNSFLTFASVLLRRELLQAVGLLDEGYFMYFEDSDLCFRARAAGWNLAVARDTAVLHKEGGSATSQRSSRMDRIFTASGIRFLRRYGQPQTLAPVLFVLSRLGKRIIRADFAGARAVLSGVLDWWRDTPRAFQKES
jgi:GT2 family glycosyltransferase